MNAGAILRTDILSGIVAAITIAITMLGRWTPGGYPLLRCGAASLVDSKILYVRNGNFALVQLLYTCSASQPCNPRSAVWLSKRLDPRSGTPVRRSDERRSRRLLRTICTVVMQGSETTRSEGANSPGRGYGNRFHCSTAGIRSSGQRRGGSTQRAHRGQRHRGEACTMDPWVLLPQGCDKDHTPGGTGG